MFILNVTRLHGVNSEHRAILVFINFRTSCVRNHKMQSLPGEIEGFRRDSLFVTAILFEINATEAV